jgi:DNA invertase Pin-like site-specific DNA recombinase
MIAGPDVEWLRMQVIGYIRVSTDEQAQGGVSLEAQRAKLEQYAELYDLDLIDVVVDAGVSAKNLHREGLKAALTALDGGQAAGLLVAKLDRLTRSVRDLSDLLEKYFGTKYALLSVAEKVDTSSAAGRMILNIMATVSQWEREVIGERTSAALQHKIALGQHVGSPALGFKMTEGQLETNQLELVIVERILELRAGGMTLQAIADLLNGESIPTKRGGKWHPSTITYILSRRAA